MSSEGTPLHGDRSAWNTMSFDTEHAKDIADGTLRRHLPLPGAAGGVAQSDGTDWQRVNSLPLADVAGYARGYIIRGGAADWEAHDASTSGFILVGDGTDIASVCFDWDTMAGGASADMVHTHASAGEGGQVSHDSALTGVSVDDHHNETHVINSTGPHAEASLTIGHFLRATGAAAFSFAAIAAGDLPTAIDAAKIADGSVSNTEFQYLDDYATIGLVDLTAGEVNQLENIAATTISAAQWGYLGGLDQTVATTSSPTFASLTLSGATGTNVITVPDNLANALYVTDNGDADVYLQIVTTTDSEIVIFNSGEDDVNFRVAASGVTNAFAVDGATGHIGVNIAPAAENQFTIQNTAINVTTSFYGARYTLAKTAGATDTADNFVGVRVRMTVNDNDAVHGNIFGIWFEGILDDGTVGAIGTARHVVGSFGTAQQIAGTIHGSLRGGEFFANQDGGTADDVYGVYITVDADGTVNNNACMIYLWERSGVDYGIYQAGTAVNHFGGPTSIGGTVAPLAQLHIDQSSNSAAIPILYLDQADVSEEIIQIVSTAGVGNAIELVGGKTLTVTEFVKTTINGNTRYLQAGTIA